MLRAVRLTGNGCTTFGPKIQKLEEGAALETCKIDGCYDEVHYYHLGVCKACYSGLSYWRGRSQLDKYERIESLSRLNGRMQHMLDSPRNVPHRRSRK